VARRAKQLVGFFGRYPAFDCYAVRTLADLRLNDVEVLTAPASLDYLERISGGARFVDEDRGNGALVRGDFVLVRPSPVVRHRGALEDRRVELARVFGVGNRWIVDQHDQRLSPYVEPLVVVPAVLGSDRAVADEDHVRGFDLDFLSHAARDGHEILGER